MTDQKAQTSAGISHGSAWQFPQGWIRTGDVTHLPPEDSCWMILTDDFGLGEQMSLQLVGAQQRVIELAPGQTYNRTRHDRYSIRPGVRNDYNALLRRMRKNRPASWHIAHLWSMQNRPGQPDELLERSVCSLIYLLEEFNRQGVRKMNLAVISNALHSGDAFPNRLVRDSLLPILQIASAQFPEFVCRSIDVDTSARSAAQIAIQIIREQTSQATDPVVAYRGDERWVRRAERASDELDRLSAAQGKAEPAGRFEVSPRQQAGCQEASSEVEAALAQLWQQLLGAEQVSPDDDFFDLGGDSITALRLFKEINSAYKAEFSLSTIFEARTIRQLAEVIEREKAQTRSELSRSSALVAIQPKGGRPPLHVISGLGGNVIKFQRLAFYLGEDQPLFGLLPRGLDGKEPYFTSVEEMASYYVDAIQQGQPRGPYRLIGYSFGGLIAFEVARQIAGRGGEVSFLGVLDTGEPQYLERVQKTLPLSERYRVYQEHIETFMTSGDSFGRLRNLVLRKLSRITYRIYRARAQSVPQKLANIEDINLLAAIGYKPGTYPGTLTIFRSSERHVSEGDDRFLGWQGLAREINVVDMASNHYNILKEPNVRLLAERLKDRLSVDGTRALLPEMSHP